MPLARIITDSVDESLELTMQLRSRGFQVETVAPGEVPSTPADLEVRLEECNSEDMLTRTAQVSGADDLCVFVAPGALDESVRPMRTIPLVPPVIRVPEAKAKPQPRLKVPDAPARVPCKTPEVDPIPRELLEFQKQPNPGVTVKPRPTNGNGAHGAHPESAMAAPATAADSPTAVPVAKDSVTHSRAFEIVAHKVDVVLFPTAPDSQLRLRSEGEAAGAVGPGASSERALGSSAELRFWRIACLAATLAIAALLLGVKLSRAPQSPAPPLQTAPTKPSGSPPNPRVTVVPGKNKWAVPSPAKPRAGEVKVASAAQPHAAPAPRGPRNAQRRRRVAHSHGDDTIATDIVVFFDRKGSRTAQKLKPEPIIKRSDLN